MKKLLMAGIAILSVGQSFGEDWTQEGVSSYYGPGFIGKKTASGHRMSHSDMTAAHRTLPIGTRIIVTDLITGKSVSVIINDRGPYAKHRILDLAEKPASIIGLKPHGTEKVKIIAVSFPSHKLTQRK